MACSIVVVIVAGITTAATPVGAMLATPVAQLLQLLLAADAMAVLLPIIAAILAKVVVDCCQVWADVCVAVMVMVVATLVVATPDTVLLL